MNTTGSPHTGHLFKPGHKFHPPFSNPAKAARRANIAARRESEDVFSGKLLRLKNKLIRALKNEYGPDLTPMQLEHIRNAADCRARLEFAGELADPIIITTLINTQHRELEALND